MARLAETLPLAGVEIDERGVEIRGGLDRGVDPVGGHVRGALERNVEAHLVVLERNCKMGVRRCASECVCSRSCGEETWTQSVKTGVRIRTQRQGQ